MSANTCRTRSPRRTTAISRTSTRSSCTSRCCASSTRRSRRQLLLAVRQIRARRPGARHLSVVVAAHRAVPVLRQRLEDRPEPLRQPGSRHGLARQIAARSRLQLRTTMERERRRWQRDASALDALARLVARVRLLRACARRRLAAETPKRGGTLTYMIPADAPPSLRRASRRHLRDVAGDRAVLQRADPHQPGKPVIDDRFRLRSVHRDAEADRRRQDLHLQAPRRRQVHDGAPLTAADVAASWEHIIFPPEGYLSPRKSWFTMVDKIEAPDPHTVVFRLKFATYAFLPALADPFAFIYQKANLDKDPHWYEKNILGSGPFKFVAIRDRPVDHRRAQPRLLSPGASPISTASPPSSPPSRRPGSRRSAATARRSSSAGCRRRRATS